MRDLLVIIYEEVTHRNGECTFSKLDIPAEQPHLGPLAGIVVDYPLAADTPFDKALHNMLAELQPGASADSVIPDYALEVL